jgi:hypothetical protein
MLKEILIQKYTQLNPRKDYGPFAVGFEEGVIVLVYRLSEFCFFNPHDLGISELG